MRFIIVLLAFVITQSSIKAQDVEMNKENVSYSIGLIIAKNLKSQLRKFLKFCELLNEDCVPISVEQLCLYIQFLSTELKSPQSIRNYVSGLKTFQLFL